MSKRKLRLICTRVTGAMRVQKKLVTFPPFIRTGPDGTLYFFRIVIFRNNDPDIVRYVSFYTVIGANKNCLNYVKREDSNFRKKKSQYSEINLRTYESYDAFYRNPEITIQHKVYMYRPPLKTCQRNGRLMIGLPTRDQKKERKKLGNGAAVQPVLQDQAVDVSGRETFFFLWT